jgi:NADPH-dependent curcumin reductase CurA
VAAQLGCRVIGITGSAEKAAWITEELGFDAAVNRQDGDVAEQLRALCPDGIDLYFDNVGGAILDAALENMALFGRIAVCGLLANYGEEGPIPGPYKFDQVLMKRLTFTGFFSPDFYHRGPDVNRRLRPWYEAGRLRMTFDVTDGLENTLTAYGRLFSGAKIGKSLVRLVDGN